MGSQISKIEDTFLDFYKKTWPEAWYVFTLIVFMSRKPHMLFIFRYLSPSFLASVGSAGYVAYALSKTRAVPSSSNVSFLHLIGVAGKNLALILKQYVDDLF